MLKVGGRMNIDKKELEKFLNYLQDKVEDCYKKETAAAIKEFLKDCRELSWLQSWDESAT